MGRALADDCQGVASPLGRAYPVPEPSLQKSDVIHAGPIESRNAQLRKIPTNRGQFLSEQAALERAYLAAPNLETPRAATPGPERARLKQALHAFNPTSTAGQS